MRASKRTEHGEQAAVIQWAGLQEGRWPELRTLYAIPNAGGYSGGFKSNVGRVQRMKAEGVKSGVPDLCLPVPRNGKHGLYIEMKVKPNKPTEEQLCWLADLDRLGHHTAICYSADEAILEITNYLTGGDLK